MTKVPPTILGACGEYYVASYLSGMGLVVALTRKGTPTTDLMVTSESGGHSISLQVKSGGSYSHVVYKRKPKYNYWVWRTGRKAMFRPNRSHWYAFVYVGDWPHGKDLLQVFFVPSKVVADRVKTSNQKEWFWIYDVDTTPYCGLEGFRKLKKAIAGRT